MTGPVPSDRLSAEMEADPTLTETINQYRWRWLGADPRMAEHAAKVMADYLELQSRCTCSSPTARDDPTCPVEVEHRREQERLNAIFADVGGWRCACETCARVGR